MSRRMMSDEDRLQSIYVYTRRKLIGHGANNTVEGCLVLTDTNIFLLFVKLERAVRSDDFDSIHHKVLDIEEYLRSINARHLLIFVYLYLSFLDSSYFGIRQESLKDGGVRYVKDYRFAVSSTQIAIDEWAKAMRDRYQKHFFRIIYANNDE